MQLTQKHQEWSHFQNILLWCKIDSFGKKPTKLEIQKQQDAKSQKILNSLKRSMSLNFVLKNYKKSYKKEKHLNYRWEMLRKNLKKQNLSNTWKMKKKREELLPRIPKKWTKNSRPKKLKLCLKNMITSYMLHSVQELMLVLTNWFQLLPIKVEVLSLVIMSDIVITEENIGVNLMMPQSLELHGMKFLISVEGTEINSSPI